MAGPTFKNGTHTHHHYYRAKQLSLNESTEPATLRLTSSLMRILEEEAKHYGIKRATYLAQLIEIGRRYYPIEHLNLSQLTDSYYRLKHIERNVNRSIK